MSELCKEKGIKQKFYPVGDHRGCGLIERFIPTNKRNNANGPQFHGYSIRG